MKNEVSYIVLRVEDREVVELFSLSKSNSSIELHLMRSCIDLLGEAKAKMRISRDSRPDECHQLAEGIFQILRELNIASDESGPVDNSTRTESLLLEEASAGNVIMQKALAALYSGRSLRYFDESLLEKAERWYLIAAESGDDESRQYLAGRWEQEKRAFRSYIQRKKQEGTREAN
jgi:ATP-dependent Clp protease ATP-binding subunit ClpA